MRALFLAALLLVALPEPTFAKTCTVTSRGADLDVATMVELTQYGEAALIEATPGGGASQVVMFAVLDAPAEKIWDALMDVESYPKFIHTVVSAKVIKKQPNQIAFDWELDVPFFNLKGTRAQRGQRPSVIEVKGVSGQLRGTKERWELYPLPDKKRTLVAFYRSLDVDTGGVLLETMIKLEPSMDQGVTLATGFVHLHALERYVEGLPLAPTIPAHTGPVPAFRPVKIGEGGIPLAKLEPLLAHGQLALIESHPDGALKQIAIFALVGSSKMKIAGIVQDPGKYPDFIPNFAAQKATPMGDHQIKMEWELEVPLANLVGESLMTIEADESVDVVAQTGDITRGRWRWEFIEIAPETTIPIHYAYSDVRGSSWVTKKLVEKEPLFEHGIVFASGTVAMTAMKARAEGRR